MVIHAVTPVLNVSSVGQSLDWFEQLGWQRGFSWNQAGMIGQGPEALGANEHGEAGFGSVCSGQATIFLCCGAQGSRGTILPRFPGDDATDGVWMSWWMGSRRGRRTAPKGAPSRHDRDLSANQRALGRARVPPAAPRRPHLSC